MTEDKNDNVKTKITKNQTTIIAPDTLAHQKILQTSLAALTDDVLYVAFELRLMAAAQGPYARFTTASPHIKNLLETAAALLEESRKGATD